MPISIATAIRQHLPLPTIAEASRYLLLACAAGCTLALLQGVMWFVIEWRFHLDSISFPLAIEAGRRAGDWINLVGWGYLVNDSYTITSVFRWIYEMVFIAVAAVAFCRVLGWGLLVSFAGVVANMIEFGSRQAVLDWIILPNGGDGVRGLSLGDLAIYGGIAWAAWMLMRLWTRGIREAAAAFLQWCRRSA
jgi:hypothetical protein